MKDALISALLIGGFGCVVAGVWLMLGVASGLIALGIALVTLAVLTARGI